MAVEATSPQEFLCGIFHSMLFMLIGAAFYHFAVLGRRFPAACSWQRLWKQYHWRLVPRWPWPAQRRRIGVTSAAAGKAAVPTDQTTDLVPAQEQLASEVAMLLKQGRGLSAAVELLQRVRTAKGTLQPGPACFRMVLQRLACSPPKTQEGLNRVTQEMTLHSFPADDALSQASCVRCLCRGPSVDVEKAHSAYTAMLATGIAPDLCTVECLVEAYLRMDRHDLVKPLILSLDDHGLEPSATLFAALITSCAATGAVACGMAAFQQMRVYFPFDLKAVQLGYSSVINLCAQDQQVDRALALLEESRQLSRERGLSPAPVEANLLPPLLAAAVQSGRVDLSLDLAQRVHTVLTTAFVQCPAQGRRFAAYVDGLCELLEKRQGSRALMAQVSAILSAPAAELSNAPAAISSCSDKATPAGGSDKQKSSSMFRFVQSVGRLAA